MSVPIPASDPVVVPASAGAVYDRWGVPRVAIDADEATGVVAVRFTAVRGDATSYSPRPEDRVELSIPDLAARFGGDPESLALVQQVQAGLLGLAAKELAARGVA